MNDFEKIVSLCKSSVHLTVNDHLSVYKTVEDYLLDCFSQEIPYIKESGMFDKMVNNNTIWLLQFYPLTPIGFDFSWGTSFKEVCDGALQILKELNDEKNN